MSNQSLTVPPPRLLFFGTRGLFSRLVLESILAQGWQLAAIVVAGEQQQATHPLLPPPPLLTGLPLVPSYVEQTIAEVGWQRAIPVWSTGRIDAALLAMAQSIGPTAVVVACWPTRLPDALLILPPWGCLNVHPSLLPDYRGPAPLFWQLRDGKRESGITIHRMTPRLDEGDILAQAPCFLAAGATGGALDRQLGYLGGQLLGTALAALRGGTSTPRAQAAGGSYHSWPHEEDFIVPPAWSARHAWNFIRGTRDWGHPYTIPLPDGPLLVQQALDIAPRAHLSRPYVIGTDSIAVQFTPGVLRVAPLPR